MIKRFFIAILALVLIGGGLVGFNLFRDNMIKQIFSNLPVQILPVNTTTVEPTVWKPAISAIGTVNAAQGVDLTVETAGIVRELGFTANEKVEKGQLVLRLDDVMQVADLEAARTQLELAQATLNRSRQLQRRGVTADASLETADANARSAEASMARAEASLQTRRLVAPFDGTIGLPRVDPGSYIAPGTVVATLQDLDRMRVDFSLPEQELPVLRIGQALTVRIDENATAFTGKITGIDPRVDAASRMVALRGEIEDAGHALTPGQFVRISVALPEEKDTIALPQTTVISSLYGDYVYAVREKQTNGEPEKDAEGNPVLEVRQVFVQPGRRSGGLVELVGDSINVGDQVVTSGQNRLSNGALVKVDNTVTPDGTGQTPPPAPEAAATDAGTPEAAAPETPAEAPAEASTETPADEPAQAEQPVDKATQP